ncbi:MAG: choice-of-anchor B family protein [Flavobacteriales bacterium]
MKINNIGIFAALVVFIILLTTMNVRGQGQLNMSKVGHLALDSIHSTELNDIWGYVDSSGNEYAIVGLNKGVSVVDISTPSNPKEIFFKEAPVTSWRDIKTWNDHAYITNEQDSALMIIDLSTLPSNTNLAVSYFPQDTTWNTAHNLYIDSSGIAYIFGSDSGKGGVLMYDLSTDPKKPSLIGWENSYYSHDGMVRNDTLYSCHINDGFFSVMDVTNKSNPTILATNPTPSKFTHNAWISDNGDYLYTTDEVSGAYIASYDLRDLSNIQELDRIQSSPENGKVIPHNTHFKNQYLITSYYTDGVVIHDVSKPGNIVEIANYDTSPMSGEGFNGAWGTYPYLPSGLILVSDIEEGLFVLNANLSRGAYLEGNITEKNTGDSLNNVNVSFLNKKVYDRSDSIGDYDISSDSAGYYDVVFEKPTHFPDTVFDVKLQKDSLTTLDIQLKARPTFKVNVEVRETPSSDSIPFADVQIKNEDFNHELTTNSNGNSTLNNFIKGNYKVFAGKWGHKTHCVNGVYLDSTNNSLLLKLDTGYYDDFTFDNNWETSGNAKEGHWRKQEPKGTKFLSVYINPDSDDSTDCSNEAFITGKRGRHHVNYQAHDVDSGEVILKTPKMNLSNYKDPYINFKRWFLTAKPNDTMSIFITNGNDSIKTKTLTSNEADNKWIEESIRLKDHISLTDSMHVIFTVADRINDNAVEGGIDKFMVIDSFSVNVKENAVTNQNNDVKLYPNPAKDKFIIEFKKSFKGKATIRNIAGKKIYKKKLKGKKSRLNISSLKRGLYQVILRSENRDQLYLKKFVKK